MNCAPLATKGKPTHHNDVGVARHTLAGCFAGWSVCWSVCPELCVAVRCSAAKAEEGCLSLGLHAREKQVSDPTDASIRACFTATHLDFLASRSCALREESRATGPDAAQLVFQHNTTHTHNSAMCRSFCGAYIMKGRVGMP